MTSGYISSPYDISYDYLDFQGFKIPYYFDSSYFAFTLFLGGSLFKDYTFFSYDEMLKRLSSMSIRSFCGGLESFDPSVPRILNANTWLGNYPSDYDFIFDGSRPPSSVSDKEMSDPVLYFYSMFDSNIHISPYMPNVPYGSDVGKISRVGYSSIDEALNSILSGALTTPCFYFSCFRVLSFSRLIDPVSSMAYVQFKIELLHLSYGFFVHGKCCYPDFSPIVRILGGTPSSDQLNNLKSICHLLGVNTSENGLKDCDLMKEYLKRLNQILGGSPYSEPNDNLKTICYLLGVDNSENGLKDCDLSKDYVKRISKMLGAE